MKMIMRMKAIVQKKNPSVDEEYHKLTTYLVLLFAFERKGHEQ